ncbi:hypothetical protein D3C57_143600 [Streptomyces rapamycinicus NRRL 5491]|uniref:Uncharacterized protein n=2 Tax=Streptomyces rapamycinicus TaxID=1226757 RepID=A0A3L8R979_STRRN|nr:hypothetical protein D3C57_143600 [Streptomyces rapamycinicus NRRL 5491]
MDADDEAGLVLAQTAILLDRRGDRETSQLLSDAGGRSDRAGRRHLAMGVAARQHLS